jgi:hypothetical protein
MLTNTTDYFTSIKPIIWKKPRSCVAQANLWSPGKRLSL